MEKVHTINFNTDDEIEVTTKKVADCVKKAYASDAKEEKRNVAFIKALFGLVRETFEELSENTAKTLDAYEKALTNASKRDKRSFTAHYLKLFSDIAIDVVELSKEHAFLNIKAEKEK